MSDNNEHERRGQRTISTTSRFNLKKSARAYRTLTRSVARDRFPRHRQQRHLAELVGVLIKHHGLTVEMQQRVVCLYWSEIAGAGLASKTYPIDFHGDVLHVATVSSSWVHEMQFRKTKLVTSLHEWLVANQVWLGTIPRPFVTDIRFMLSTRRRSWLVEPDHIRELRQRERQLRRLRPEPRLSPVTPSDAERVAIIRETSAVEDDDLRTLIERVRLQQNL